MTTLYDTTVKCPNCRTLNTIYMIGSTNSFGAGDLDTRPAEMARSTILYGVESCSKCGLAAGRLEGVGTQSLEYFRSDDFKKKHESEKFKDLAKNYWTAFLLSMNAGDHVEAFYHILRAAWASDDRRESGATKRARQLLIDTLRHLKEGPSFLTPEQPMAGYLMLADITRRTGRFDEAKMLAQHVKDNEHGFIGGLAQLEIELCEKKETACYTMEGIKRLV